MVHQLFQEEVFVCSVIFNSMIYVFLYDCLTSKVRYLSCHGAIRAYEFDGSVHVVRAKPATSKPHADSTLV